MSTALVHTSVLAKKKTQKQYWVTLDNYQCRSSVLKWIKAKMKSCIMATTCGNFQSPGEWTWCNMLVHLWVAPHGEGALFAQVSMAGKCWVLPEMMRVRLSQHDHAEGLVVRLKSRQVQDTVWSAQTFKVQLPARPLGGVCQEREKRKHADNEGGWGAGVS